MDLQWPHQGAWNLMKTVLPEVSASTLSGVREWAAAAVRHIARMQAFIMMKRVVEEEVWKIVMR